MRTTEIYLGIRDLVDEDSIEIHRDDVPPLPVKATGWLSKNGKDIVYDYGDHRWRYDKTGDLIAYFLYRKIGESGIKKFWCNE